MALSKAATGILSMLVIVAFLGNALVIYVLLARRKSFLTKPYGIFILNLAVVDCITAILLIFSGFLYLPPIQTYSQIAADTFCVAIWAPWIPFTLGYISIYTCLSLAVERWLAVVKPGTYRALRFHHAIFALIFVWVMGAAVNITTVFRFKYDAAAKTCKYMPIPNAESILIWTDFTLQTLFPMSTMVVLYCHMYYTLKKLPSLTSSRDNQLKKVTKIAFAACSALIIGWLPGRITFMLTKFGIMNVRDKTHIACVMFTFLNSCVNPFLYAICCAQFRKEYKLVIGKLAMCFKRPGQQVAVEN